MMRTKKYRSDRLKAVGCWIALLFMLTAAACGGSSLENNQKDNGQRQSDQTSDWQISLSSPLNSGGTVTPNVKAVYGSDGRIHIIYFSDGPPDGENLIYTLNYLIYIPEEELLLQQNPKPAGPTPEAEGVDNCNPAALAIDADNTPIVAYQGGNLRPMGEEEQSDVMVSLIENADNDWSEYTGAIGYVERNPFHDGLAKPDLDLAVDSNGDIHLCFQFFYEGIDADNDNYPDLNYVLKRRNSLSEPTNEDDWATWEETVHGNDFQIGGGEQNSVGYRCKIVLDADERPVILYAEHSENTDTYALWAATRNGADSWERLLVDQFEESYRVNAISAAVSPVDGSLAVAYQLNYLGDESDHGDHLRFCQQVNGAWTPPIIVDQSSWCGDDASLAFDSAGNPAIAYYADNSHTGHEIHDLKLARFNGVAWQIESVATNGDVGHYNSIWFDDANRINICTYSRSEDTIIIYSKPETY